jgi:hypothetical protein
MFHRYGFIWRKNSCPQNSIGTGYASTYYCNLTEAGMTLFSNEYQDFCEVYYKLFAGLASVHKCSRQMELLIYNRIQHAPVVTECYRDVLNHRYTFVPDVMNIFFIPCTATNNDRFVFSYRIYERKLCSHCNQYTILERDTKDRLTYCMSLNVLQPITTESIMFSIGSVWGSEIQICPYCLGILTTIPVEEYVLGDGGPLFLNVKHAHEIQTHGVIEKNLIYNEIEYVLNFCIYGSGIHFMTILHNFNDNRYYSCDGVMSDSQFLEYRGDMFPVDYGRFKLVTCTYGRKEFCKPII